MKKSIPIEPTPESITHVLNLLAAMPDRLEHLVKDPTDPQLHQPLRPGERSLAETLAHLVHCEGRSSEAIYLALLVNEPLMPEVHPERQWGKLLRYDLLEFSDLLVYFRMRRTVLVRVLRSLNEAQWRRVVCEAGKKRKESVYWRV